MSWIEIGLACLKLALALLDWAKGKQQFNAGQDAEIAKNALAILDKTETGKRITEKLRAMSDGDLDAVVDDLGR